MTSRCNLLWMLSLVPAFSMSLPAAEQDSANISDFQQHIQPLLAQYCYRCHGAQTQKADLRLDRLDTRFSKSAQAETWHDVLNRLNLGEMPPQDAKQPTPEQLEQLTDWLTLELKKATAAKQSTGGHVVLRRLTRYEYKNTLHDLLGIDYNFAEDLPPEPSSEDGFQNSGRALGMSPLQLELYLQAARTALSKAIVTGPQPEVHQHTATDSISLRRMTTSNHVTPETVFIARLMEYPTEGEILVRVEAGAIIPDTAGFPRMRITCGMKSDVLIAEEELGAIDVTAPADDPQIYEFRARIEQFPLPGHNPKFPGVMITVHNDYATKKTEKPKKRPRRKKGQTLTPDPTVPTIVIKSVEFTGPVFESWPPRHHTRILIPRDESDDEPTYARKVIERFASRAYRRPAMQSEVELLESFFNRIRNDYPSFEEAMRETLAMVLVSPEFLYLMEPNQRSKTRQPLTDFELASRLSYFLWSSMPDEKLLALAQSGRLRRPDVLENQVRQMIDDPKSSRFVEHFTDQWLNLSGLNRVAVNPEYYPDFDDRLKPHMRRETQHFFAEILHGNLSALNLIDSDYAMLNRPLARHYGLAGPRGTEFERVVLSTDDRRGGLLAQGSILLSNSTGEDSHPIRRAVWLLERLLASPPPSPPPDVPELNSEDPNLLGLPLKRQLELHRKKESCNNCHRKIDPWGIAFEHYDGVGKWRTDVLRVPGKGPDRYSPVVASATLPGGHEIDGLSQLKQYLLTHERSRFSRAIVTKLLAYSLGRSLEFEDEGVVESLAKKFADADYRISDLIVAIVQSDPFQQK